MNRQCIAHIPVTTESNNYQMFSKLPSNESKNLFMLSKELSFYFLSFLFLQPVARHCWPLSSAGLPSTAKNERAAESLRTLGFCLYPHYFSIYNAFPCSFSLMLPSLFISCSLTLSSQQDNVLSIVHFFSFLSYHYPNYFILASH